MTVDDMERAAAAQYMIAQDARWISDAMLSTSSHPDSAAAVALALAGNSSRIVYEGGKFIRKAQPDTGLLTLAGLLPGAHAAVIERARHATKLLDDNKRSVEDLADQMESWLEVHRIEFLGKSHRLARFLETDLGLFAVDGQLLFGTIPMQFKLGIAAGIRIEGLGPHVRAIAKDQGGVLAVLNAVDGDPSAVVSRQDYSSLGEISGRDVRSKRYLARRYDQRLSVPDKLLLLLIEGEITTTDVLLPLTQNGHAEAVFRARVIGVFHALSAVRHLLAKTGNPLSASAADVSSILGTDAAQWILTDVGARRLRNQCVHYAVFKDVEVDFAQEMVGLVPALTAGRTLDDVDADLVDLASQLARVLRMWRA